MAAIVNHRIAGTRISVWDVLHHLDNNWTLDEIAEVFGISPQEVQAAAKYIAEHEDEVRDVHRRLEERNARGNSAEVESKLDQARARRLAWLRERHQADSREASRVGNRA
ncbi:MAG: DUF433 domain-containing protein [Planctomycetes bacterium]|nr:DUF433 domain-containing protein [Planctomycetota bacterium]